MNTIQKVLNNKYLLDYIYQFDNTFRLKFKQNIINNNILLDGVHTFWYDKYKKALMNIVNNLNLRFWIILLHLVPTFGQTHRQLDSLIDSHYYTLHKAFSLSLS